MPSEIVKVQVPIIGDGPALVYAKDRARMRQMPISLAVRKALLGNGKGYFNAEWSKLNGWRIGDRVADQEW